MAFGTTPAGTITKEQTRLSIRRFPVAGGENIAKGDLCVLAHNNGLASSAVYQADNSSAFGSEWVVALEPANNTSGSSGDITVPVAVKGHYVTVVSDGTIEPGRPIKASTTKGRVLAFVEGTDAEGLKVGIYYGKEGGTIAKATATPYLESFTDSADFIAVKCAQADVIEVLLR